MPLGLNHKSTFVKEIRRICEPQENPEIRTEKGKDRDAVRGLSYLKAALGSTPDALWAGTEQATSATEMGTLIGRPLSLIRRPLSTERKSARKTFLKMASPFLQSFQPTDLSVFLVPRPFFLLRG